MKSHDFVACALAACALGLSPPHAGAQTAGGTLSEVTVTGEALGRSESAAPAERLEGTGLLLRSQGTLGETLDGLPGVSSTHFGPTVSRPVLRGLEGDRTRILHNGGASVDVSGLSFDHAVPVDPIAIDRIEVLRGPAALLYGGNAVGGVVNMVDDRIPRAPVDGVTGRVDAGVASGNRERGGAAMVEGGSARYALHVDAYARRSGDVRVPAGVPCAGGSVVQRRICNTAQDTRGGALGGTLFLDRGWIGASTSGHRSDYGSAAEEDVAIGLRTTRDAIEAQWRPSAGPLAAVRLLAGHTAYRHTEFEAGQPGTTFRNDGNDARIELRHQPIGPWSGVVGLQSERTRFAADGAEAFAPYSRTSAQAFFVHEEMSTRWGSVSAALRREDVHVESLGHPTVARFAPDARRYAPTSAAIAAAWKLAPAWQLTVGGGRSERAPRDYELYADGPHVATGAWEIGNARLPTERSNYMESALAWKDGANTARIAGWASRYASYVALVPTGATRASSAGDALPEYAYQGVRARLQGLEASGTWRLLRAGPTVDVEWRADAIHARNADTGEPLPRIAPARLGATWVLAQAAWSARLGFDAHARQSQVPAASAPTPGYVMWNAAVTRRQQAGGTELLWYARLDNITDVAARSATSILTQTAPQRAWLAGRSLRVGVRADF